MSELWGALSSASVYAQSRQPRRYNRHVLLARDLAFEHKEEDGTDENSAGHVLR